MNQHGFRLTIDDAGHAQLACSACERSHRFEQDEPEVVTAAVTTTFMAAHEDCRVSASA